MSLSVTLPAKKFQLFQPIGGVAAMDLLWAKAAAGERRRSAMRRRCAGCAIDCMKFSPLDSYRMKFSGKTLMVSRWWLVWAREGYEAAYNSTK
jgi:hypothetical protein